jgi:amidase
MSLLSDMAVCQVVDPLLTMRVEFPLAVLEKYGYKLP